MTDSTAIVEAAPTARPGKRERLVAAARDLLYRQGVERTTLADIAQAADVPVGNVYYYFKTKDDIVAAVVQTRVADVESLIAELESRHRSPKARLKALVRVWAEQGDLMARHGCPLGTLSSELAKRAGESDPLAAPLMEILLAWAEQQFRSMCQRDPRELAVELVVNWQGSAVLANALGQPEIVARHTKHLEKWIEKLQT
jgi:TetR/AcrR family transcriptional regulator, transcriptional repressor for nem operon